MTGCLLEEANLNLPFPKVKCAPQKTLQHDVREFSPSNQSAANRSWERLAWTFGRCSSLRGICKTANDLNMVKPENEPHFVVCHCQFCNKNIEFDASDFADDETRQVQCPHCDLETVIFVPKAILSPKLTPARVKPPPPLPVWFGTEASVIEIRLTSGATLKIKAVGLYYVGELNAIAEQKSQAETLLEGVHNPYAAWGDIFWVTFSTRVTNMMEKSMSREAARKGIALLQELAERERKLRENIKFFPVGQIQ